MKATVNKTGKDTVYSGMQDPKASMGGSVGATFSTIPNINKQKRSKLMLEANPMVIL
jgi:hypothetical protein